MSEKDKSSHPHHPMKLIGIVLLWLLALYVALNFMRSSETPQSSSRPPVPSVKHRGVCKSPECITLAHQLHNWRDVSVDPCEDFYKAVCGKYNEHSLVSGNRLIKKEAILVQLIKEFLDKKESSESKSETAMKRFYEKCEKSNTLNETEHEVIRKTEQLKMIQEINYWPLLDKNWREDDFDLNDMLTRMAWFGRSSFGLFQLNVQTTYFFVRTDSVLPQNYSSKVEKMFIELLEFSGKKIDLEVLKEDIKGVMELNRKIAELETIIRYTPKRVLANYLTARFLLSLEENTKIATDENGNTKCVEKVMEKLPLASLRVFVRNHFDKENIKIASDLVEEIRKNLIEVFEKTTWLHQTTRERAIHKLKSVRKTVGYPEELEVPGALDRFFEELNLSENLTYYAARVELERFQTSQLMNFMSGKLRLEPRSSAVKTNAAYSPMSNSFTLGVVMLDDPLFDSTFPQYAKIASIGEIIGHEMGHGYGPTGRLMDENGTMSNWWTPEDSAEYDRRAQCLIDQFDNYDDPDFGRNLNGTLAIEEIVPDIIGADVSWTTYKKVDFENEPSIFGFEDEKPDKLFFHLTALNHCRPRDQISLEKRLTDTHPTSSFRVNGIFSNMKQFAEAFNCPIGSPMNPEKKCEMF